MTKAKHENYDYNNFSNLKENHSWKRWTQKACKRRGSGLWFDNKLFPHITTSRWIFIRVIIIIPANIYTILDAPVTNRSAKKSLYGKFTRRTATVAARSSFKNLMKTNCYLNLTIIYIIATFFRKFWSKWPGWLEDRTKDINSCWWKWKYCKYTRCLYKRLVTLLLFLIYILLYTYIYWDFFWAPFTLYRIASERRDLISYRIRLLFTLGHSNPVRDAA